MLSKLTFSQFSCKKSIERAAFLESLQRFLLSMSDVVEKRRSDGTLVTGIDNLTRAVLNNIG